MHAPTHCRESLSSRPLAATVLRSLALAALLVAVPAQPGLALTIAQWTFSAANTSGLPSSGTVNIAPEFGIGNLATTGRVIGSNNNVGVWLADPSNSPLELPDDGTGLIWSSMSENYGGNQMVLSIDTTALVDLMLTVDVTGSVNRTWFVSTSPDGTNYTGADTFLPSAVWTRRTFDLSAVDSIENLSTAYIGIHVGSSQNPNGASFDNITVTGVPEPSTALLLGGGLLALAARGRRRKA